MGNAAARLPTGVKRLNDSLYELYSPSDGVEPQLDIIFFHGLQPLKYANAYWRTWFNGTELWPQTLLIQAFPQARVLSVSYDSCAQRSRTGGRMDMTNIAEALYGDILSMSPRFPKVGSRPVVLVGHSLGGLVIKKFIMTADKQMNTLDPKNYQDEIDAIRNFFENLLGVFYYATPHGGSDLADLVSRLPGASPVLLFLKTFGKEASWLNTQFQEWRTNHNKVTCTLYETRPTGYWGLNAVIVNEAAARQGGDQIFPANEDHISICKPKTMNTTSFEKLETFIRSRLKALAGTSSSEQT